MITLVTPFVGRWYSLAAYLASLEQLDYEKKEINIIFLVNTKDNIFVAALQNWITLNGAHWGPVKVLSSDLPVLFQNNDNVDNDTLRDNRAKLIASMHNLAREKALETTCDYIWFIEDDIAVPPDACKKHLALLKDKADVSSCFAVQRYTSQRFSRQPLAWHLEKKKTFGENDSCQECQLYAHQAEIPLCEWIEKIDCATFASIMFKRKVLEEIVFQWSHKGLINHDIVLGYQLSEKGYNIYIDWSLKVKHIHYTGEIV